MDEVQTRRGPGRPSKAELEARHQMLKQGEGAEPEGKPSAKVEEKVPLIKYICKKCKRTSESRSHQIAPLICAWCRQPMKYTVDLPTE